MDEQNKTVQPEAAAAPESRPLKKPAPAKDEAPRRRVGSFTLGISLIAAGILFLCYYFVPERQQTANRLSQTYTDTL